MRHPRRAKAKAGRVSENDKYTRDKSTLIANLVVLMEPGLMPDEYLEMAEPLWSLDIPDLLKISEFVLDYQIRYSTPRFVRPLKR